MPLSAHPIWPNIPVACGAGVAHAAGCTGGTGACPVIGSAFPETLAISFTIHFMTFSKSPSFRAAGTCCTGICTSATGCTGGIGICTGCTDACTCCGTVCAATVASHTRLYGFQGVCAGICACIGSIFLFCLRD